MKIEKGTESELIANYRLRGATRSRSSDLAINVVLPESAVRADDGVVTVKVDLDAKAVSELGGAK